MMDSYFGQACRFGSRDHSTPLGQRRFDRGGYGRPMGRGGFPPAGGGCRPQGGYEPPRPQSLPHRPPDSPPSPREACRSLPVMEKPERGGGNRGACGRLLQQLRGLDFALYEVILYLDVYPHSCEALETYHKLKSQRDALRREYEATCGPLTPFGNESDTTWDWINVPFPWEYDAN